MLGRHVYRVQSLGSGAWAIQKEGEATRRDGQTGLEEAVTLATALASADQPSRLIVEDDRGRIMQELIFGSDDADALAELASRSLAGTK